MMRGLTVTLLMLVLAACGSSNEAATQPASGPGSAASVPAAPVPPPPPIPEDGIVCPADVQLCPDGSYVSRSPARRCAFDPCPGAR